MKNPPFFILFRFHPEASLEVFSSNKTTDKYDASCTGWIEFYYSRMEKSTEPKIDSVMTNYTIKKFDYVALITNGKNIERIKSK